jgi:hypothetical protein
MSDCIFQDFPCRNPDYTDFDNIARSELLNPPSVHKIINESKFCTFVPIDEAIQLGDLTHRDFLKGLREKVGLYHLWIDHDNCDEHKANTMLCVYAGKGTAEVRINDHIKNKWPETAYLYVSFYECTNRLAKYLEQLFLDTYSFELNNNENSGEKQLYAVWSEGRHDHGTEVHAVSRLSNIQSFDDL